MIGGLFKSASRVALVAAAGVLAGGVAAQAADLGGNCCADLEERVAELEATTARKGNRKVSLTVYGQVNQQLLWHDDDYGYREGKVTVRDNDAGMSRFGFRGEAQIRPDLTAGYVIEIGLGDQDYGMAGNVDDEKSALSIRHNYLYLDSKTFGRVSIGQTSQVTDGLYEISLANAQLTPGSMDEHVNVLGGDIVSTFKTGFDGGRKQGVYYRTPTMAGFVASVGYSHDTQSTSAWDAADYFEGALRYAGEFNGVRLAAGIGYRNKEDDNNSANDSDTWLGSASAMHTPTGLFVSGGYATTEFDNSAKDTDGFWVMAGIEKNWFGPGATTLYAEYSEVNYDQASSVSDGTYWGLGVVQKIDAAAMDLYLQFRNYELDATEAVRDDANVVSAGAIIRF